jgi:iron complex outermembrane receptor protein
MKSFGFNPKIDPGASVGSRSINEFLPYLGLNYSVADNTQVYLAYGKTIGAGKVNQYPNYMQSRSAFERVGVTLQQIWDTLEPEIADKFDLGLRISDGHWYIAPTFYYSKKRKQAVNAFDPQVGVSYLQNADATGYGAELEFGMDANSQLSLFTALSYNILSLTEI